MGNLKFTKQFSSSNNGETINGSDIGTIQADIASILNGGITNVNIATSAAIAESKLAFDTTSGHNHDGSTSRTISSSGVILRSLISGAELVWVSTTTCKATAGAIEINGAIYTTTADSTTMDLTNAAHYIGGISQRAVSKWLYIYAYNSTGTSWDIKMYDQAPQYSNCGTSTSGPLIYREAASVWYRCIGAIRLNATGSGEIDIFYQQGNTIILDTTVTELSNGADAAFTDVDLSSSVPSISTIAICILDVQDGENLYIRPNGSSSTNGWQYASSGASIYLGDALILTSSAQVIEYKEDGANKVGIIVKGYIINVR